MVDYAAEHPPGRLHRTRHDFWAAMGGPGSRSGPFSFRVGRVPFGIPRSEVGHGLDDRSVGTSRPGGSEENLAGACARCRQLFGVGCWILFQQGVLARDGISRQGKLPHSCAEPSRRPEPHFRRGRAGTSYPGLRQEIVRRAAVVRPSMRSKRARSFGFTSTALLRLPPDPNQFSRSEVKPQRKLQVPLATTDAASLGCYLSEGRAGRIEIHTAAAPSTPVRMVDEIECLSAELKSSLLVNGKGLEEAEVPILKTRLINQIPHPLRVERTVRRFRKDGSVKPL